jgi:hypothetical protein
MVAFPPAAFSGRFFAFLSMVESRCNLVHACPQSIMIDSPWRLLRAPESGKFGTVRDIEFVAVAVGFGDPKRRRKPMIRMGFLFRRVPGAGAAHATPVAEYPHPEPRSRSSHLETMP